MNRGAAWRKVTSRPIVITLDRPETAALEVNLMKVLWLAITLKGQMTAHLSSYRKLTRACGDETQRAPQLVDDDRAVTHYLNLAGESSNAKPSSISL